MMACRTWGYERRAPKLIVGGLAVGIDIGAVGPSCPATLLTGYPRSTTLLHSVPFALVRKAILRSLARFSLVSKLPSDASANLGAPQTERVQNLQPS